MESVILIALLAFTSANPLIGWGGPAGGNPFTKTWSTPQTPQQVAAHQVAQQVVQDAHHAQTVHVQEAIKQLQTQLQMEQQGQASGIVGGPNSWAHQGKDHQGPQVAAHHGIQGPHTVAQQAAHQIAHQEKQAGIVEAIQHLQNHQQQQGSAIGVHNSAATQLQQSIEAVVEAEIISENVLGQSHGPHVAPGQHVNVLHAKLQHLVDQHNVDEIQTEISHHHHSAQQLHHQQQFVNQQIQRIHIQQATAQKQGVSPQQLHQLQQAEQQLQQQQQHLGQQQLAHQIVVERLQHIVTDLEQHVQEDIAAENIEEHALHAGHPGPWHA